MLKNQDLEVKKNLPKNIFFIEIILIILIILFLGLIVYFANYKIDITIPIEKIAINEILINKKFIPYLPNNLNQIIIKSGSKHYGFLVKEKKINNQNLYLVLDHNINLQNIRLLVNKKRVINLVLSK